MTFLLHVLPCCPWSSPLAWPLLSSVASAPAAPTLPPWNLRLHNVHTAAYAPPHLPASKMLPTPLCPSFFRTCLGIGTSHEAFLDPS